MHRRDVFQKGNICGTRYEWKTYTNPDNLLHTAPGRLENGFQITAALSRLLGDGSVDEIALSVGWDLTGAPDLASCFDGLAVWSCSYIWEGGLATYDGRGDW